MGRDDDSGNVLVLFVIIVVAIIAGLSPKGCATSQQSPDLVVLPSPPFDIHSNATNDLLNHTFWAIATTSAEDTAIHIPQDTIVGYVQSSAEWRNWTLRHMPDPPPWVESGFSPYVKLQIVALEARALESGNATQAAYVLEYQAATVMGVTFASVDFASLNSASAIRTYLETGNAT